MKKKTLLIITVIVIIAMFFVYLGVKNFARKTGEVSKSDHIAKDAIVVYQKGKETKIRPDSSRFPELKTEIETIFVTANDIYEVIVTDQLIRDTKTQESSIELTYATPQRLKIEKTQQVFEISHILIPLSGRFSQPITIFYGTPEYKAPNQIVNTKKGNNKLLNILTALGIEIK